MITFPNSKINLGLNVVEKRPDGFHNLETFFYPVNWCDGLEILESDEFSFEVIGNSIDGDLEDNLIVKVYRHFEKEYAVGPCKIVLSKKIPTGAGLGGGSADAAFAAKMLNQFFDLELTDDVLENIVRPLGSDCAFFVKNEPVYAVGKGDEFIACPVDLINYQIVLVNPNIHVSTALAYSKVNPKPSKESIQEVLQLPVANWKNRIVNDFEVSVFDAFPEIAAVKELFYQLGADFALMSGSGATVFALFEKGNPLPDFSCFTDKGYTVHVA